MAVFYGISLKMGWSHLIATVLSVVVIEIFTGRWRALSWLTEKLAALGKISYSVYLTHIFSGWWVTSVLMNVAKTEGAKTVSVGIGIVVSVYFAQIFYNAVEKPTQDWRDGYEFLPKKRINTEGGYGYILFNLFLHPRHKLYPKLSAIHKIVVS
ncbi:MAG: hypothetical protein HC817_00940 [Saprospiraceae bacterium]|nr:hypothetical protein [Saprospiraceae bacterium]